MNILVVSSFTPLPKKAAMNIHLQVLGYLVSFVLGKYLGIELLGHKVSVYLISYETSKLFLSSQFIFPPTLGMGSSFNFRY